MVLRDSPDTFPDVDHESWRSDIITVIQNGCQTCGTCYLMLLEF